MPLIMRTKFQINQVIITLLAGVWDKNPTPTNEKVVKCHRQKLEKIVYRQMPAPRDLPQKIPAKIRIKSPRVRQSLGANSLDAGGRGEGNGYGKN